MRHRAPIVVLGLLLATAAVSAEPARTQGGHPSGKVNMQDMHFTSRSDAVAKCPGGVADQADGSFACSSALVEPAGMAINEKGTPGTKSTVKAQPK